MLLKLATYVLTVWFLQVGVVSELVLAVLNTNVSGIVTANGLET